MPGSYQEKAIQMMAMIDFCLVTVRPLCGYWHIDELNPGLGNRKQQGWGKARTGNASYKDCMGIWITVWTILSRV